MIKLALVGLALGMAACASRTSVPAAEQSGASAEPVPPAISLQRTPCFGSCPVYTIAVSPSGLVTYEGRAHVQVLGTAAGQIRKQRVDELLTEIERAGYFHFASRYAVSEPPCGRYVTDLPTVISTASLEGRTKRIEHDHGCGAAPGALALLEKRIDEVLGSDRWVEGEK
ncbi:MAG TPA: DUF6438 domain-containing protein [Gemmatimonadales bacterium]|nr:DUF6438 domain-containing protein [Gemmatimonadales bacterium]